MTADLIARVDGGAGRLSLNRAAALHALTLDMCHDMTTALTAWAINDAVELVIIDHAEGRGFCAGGDIRVLADSAAADGVGARRSATKSAMLKSISWPTAETTGTALAWIARATVSSLNAHRSSSEPPPRVSNSAS